MAHVLAIKCSELLAVGDGPAKLSAAQLAAAVPAEGWVGTSAGHGAKGRRLYDWTRIQLTPPTASGWQRWLLLRRSRRDGELALYACYGPVDTSLLGLVRVAGSRWAIEDGFQQAKNEAGLDHHEVRKWPGWYRHTTLALLAQAFLVVTRTKATTGDRAKGMRRLTSQLGLLPLTVPEVRRLLIALVWTTPLQPGFVLAWSRWRRRHQACPRRVHYQRREQQVRLEY